MFVRYVEGVFMYDSDIKTWREDCICIRVWVRERPGERHRERQGENKIERERVCVSAIVCEFGRVCVYVYVCVCACVGKRGLYET